MRGGIKKYFCEIIEDNNNIKLQPIFTPTIQNELLTKDLTVFQGFRPTTTKISYWPRIQDDSNNINENSTNEVSRYVPSISTQGEIVNFYIVESLNVSSSASIQVNKVPFTSGKGMTQNLGRGEITITKKIMLVDDYFNSDNTKEAQYTKLWNMYASRQKLRLNIPNLPLGTSVYYIKNIQLAISEPHRLILDMSFTEKLDYSLKFDEVKISRSTNIPDILSDLGRAPDIASPNENQSKYLSTDDVTVIEENDNVLTVTVKPSFVKKMSDRFSLQKIISLPI